MKDFVIAVDFDGTCVEHDFPRVGTDVPYAAQVITKLVEKGAKIILYTMRVEKFLVPAVEWYARHNIPLYGINENPAQTWSKSRKIYANLYIDDAAMGCPLIYPADCNRPYVDWESIWAELQYMDLHIETIHHVTTAPDQS